MLPLHVLKIKLSNFWRDLQTGEEHKAKTPSGFLFLVSSKLVSAQQYCWWSRKLIISDAFHRLEHLKLCVTFGWLVHQNSRRHQKQKKQKKTKQKETKHLNLLLISPLIVLGILTHFRMYFCHIILLGWVWRRCPGNWARWLSQERRA